MRLLAAILLIFCAALLVGVAITDQPLLPDRMASHFNGRGIPNGWMSASSFTSLMIVVGLGIPASLIGIMYAIRFFPAKFLNVPNSTYWRKPENYGKACDLLFTSSLWFGSAFLIWQIFFSRLIIEANHISPPCLDGAKVMAVTLPLLAFTFGWMIVLYLRFLRMDNEAE